MLFLCLQTRHRSYFCQSCLHEATREREEMAQLLGDILLLEALALLEYLQSP